LVPLSRQPSPLRSATVAADPLGSASATVITRSPAAAVAAYRVICSGVPNLAMAAAPLVIDSR
jgi:hypothetical protein